MAFEKVKVINCKRAAIRQDPWDIKDSNDSDASFESTAEEVKGGDTIEVDFAVSCYSWIDRRYYKVKKPDGWIYEGCVERGGSD